MDLHEQYGTLPEDAVEYGIIGATRPVCFLFSALEKGDRARFIEEGASLTKKAHEDGHYLSYQLGKAVGGVVVAMVATGFGMLLLNISHSLHRGHF